MRNRKISLWLLLIPFLGPILMLIRLMQKCSSKGKEGATKQAVILVCSVTAVCVLLFVVLFLIIDSMVLPPHSVIRSAAPLIMMWSIYFIGIDAAYADRKLSKMGLYLYDLYK